MGYNPRWRPLFHCQLHVLANDVFQDLPWPLVLVDMRDERQIFSIDRLLLE